MAIGHLSADINGVKKFSFLFLFHFVFDLINGNLCAARIVQPKLVAFRNVACTIAAEYHNLVACRTYRSIADWIDGIFDFLRQTYISIFGFWWRWMAFVRAHVCWLLNDEGEGHHTRNEGINEIKIFYIFFCLRMANGRERNIGGTNQQIVVCDVHIRGEWLI